MIDQFDVLMNQKYPKTKEFIFNSQSRKDEYRKWKLGRLSGVRLVEKIDRWDYSILKLHYNQVFLLGQR